MAGEPSWIPETLKTILSKSESHYRSVGFRRCAHLMGQTLASAESGSVPADFYEKYVHHLKDDAREFMAGFGFGPAVTQQFTESVIKAIDSVYTLVVGLDKEGKTPTFNGATSKKADVEAMNSFLDEYGGLFDPLAAATDNFTALEHMAPFYEVVYNHVFIPGRDFLISQLELAVGHTKMQDISEAILSVNGLMEKNGEKMSDFRYAFQNPGKFDETEENWILNDRVTIPVESVARWPLFMYYLVPIVTAMLPIHNVIFFSLVQTQMEKNKAKGAPSGFIRPGSR